MLACVAATDLKNFVFQIWWGGGTDETDTSRLVALTSMIDEWLKAAISSVSSVLSRPVCEIANFALSVHVFISPPA